MAVATGNASHLANHCGIQAPKQILWKGWEPGGEYTKQLVIKNSNVQTQKLHFKVPSTRFFTTLYPKTITLSAGTSFNLPVTFRPLEKISYDDYIVFRSKEFHFKVPIKAVLIDPTVFVPKRQDFGVCTVQSIKELTFQIKNTSELKVAFQWKIVQPFSIQPSSGILEPKTSCRMKALFRPEGAYHFNATAVCRYGSDYSKFKTVDFCGIGKYPHILVTGTSGSAFSVSNHETIVDFGDVPVGTKQERFIELHNACPAAATYHIMQPSKDNQVEVYFVCQKAQGVIAPSSFERVLLTYCPKTVKEKNIEYFAISAVGGRSKTVVKCEGNAIGPQISVDNAAVNFGNVAFGQETVRNITITNNSNVDGYYQLRIDQKNSVFKFSQTCGLLKAKHAHIINIVFKPSLTISYLRRVFLIIHNQEPLSIELFGSCFTEQDRPAVVQLKHIERYKKMEERGLTIFPPESLSEMLKENKLQLDENGIIMLREAEALEPYLRPYIPLSVMEEYFDLSDDMEKVVSQYVSLDQQNINFGSCTNIKSFEQRNVCITNHTRGKITCYWITSVQNVFSVTPETTDIQPSKTASFIVTFKPNASNQFYEAELECYASFKSMKQHRLVADSTIVPPWCLTLTLSGHSFQAGCDTFLPRYKFEKREVTFPTVSPNEDSYTTLLMTNTGSNPISYEFSDESLGLVSIIPRKGLLQKEYQILTLRMKPTENKIYKYAINCQLNEAEKYNEKLTLICAAEAPMIHLDDDGTLYFKPTGIGTLSTRVYSIKNVTKLPIRFHWSIPLPDQSIVKVEPAYGIIYPNEVQSHTWTFIPQDEVKYMIKVHLRAFFNKDSHLDKTEIQKSSFLLRVIGEGSIGDIKADPNVVDFGNVVVGSTSNKAITVTNSSKCNLLYKFSIEQTISGPYDQNYPSNDDIILNMDKMEGVIPARSVLNVTAFVKPKQRINYKLNVFYKLLTPASDGSNHTIKCENPLLCQVKLTGIYPTLKVVDARCSSDSNISKVGLWKLFNLDSFNMSLCSDPSPAETMYSVATRHSMRRRPPLNTRAIVDFNFGSAPVNAPPCVAYLMFKNTGPVSTDWVFLFPTDLQLDLEFWAESGDYTRDELYDMHVMDNKLFTIEPNKGSLPPNETQVVKFTYRHIMANTDRLPVVFKVMKGREILINFVGVTVEATAKYVHFPSNSHKFIPMPVGSITYPKQIYELYNGGGQTVSYELDLSPCDSLRLENYHWDVFQCLNPTGQIAPGSKAQIEWIFSPIEAKTYTVDIPVHIVGVETHIVSFYGVGYDRRLMGDSMPFVDQSDITDVPVTQSVAIPSQTAVLSQERISFGNLPLYSIEKRILFLTNKSDHKIYFHWNIPPATRHQHLHIEPSERQLQPGESILLKVIFSSYTVPSFFEIDLSCEITDETEMDKYHKKFKKWESEQEELRHTFTITDKDLIKDKSQEESEADTIKDTHAATTAENVADSKVGKYSALPPIKPFLQSDARLLQSKSLSRRQARTSDKHQPPVMPSPFILYLGITARTHSSKDYQSHFPDAVNKFHMDRSLAGHYQQYLIDSSDGLAREESKISCNVEENDVIAAAISDMLKYLIHDHDFTDVISNMYTEPIPYFRQFQGHNYRHTRNYVVEEEEEYENKTASVAQATYEEKNESSESLQATAEPKESSDETPKDVHIDADATQQTREIGTPCDSKTNEATTDENIARIPEVSNLIELVLENTLVHLLTEASKQEINLTSRPRVIALPPHRKQGINQP